MNILHFIKKPIVSKLLCGIAFLGNAAGVIASIPLALKQVMRCHCQRCPVSIAIVAAVALASLWLSRWPCCQCRLGIVAITMLASLWTLPWCHCHHSCRGAGVIAALAWPSMFQPMQSVAVVTPVSQPASH
jgi:hypothetical protein